ncbi:unnamed protein product [Lactuca saligna]|uniref:Uncharacterized protein n=1 Tax=Lactuca saligna TaxID=75948 RepID=A0AA35YJU9_LACSI|nr:unnamed protein product [Lactuca saligna]
MESLNFYMTDLVKFDFKDLELIAKNCSESLLSVKINECDLTDLSDFFNHAVKLQEFGGGAFSDQPENYVGLKFPPLLTSMALNYMNFHKLTSVDLMEDAENIVLGAFAEWETILCTTTTLDLVWAQVLSEPLLRRIILRDLYHVDLFLHVSGIEKKMTITSLCTYQNFPIPSLPTLESSNPLL